MSRIVLTRHLDGNHHKVVGWDRPLATYFWQEFNEEPTPDAKGNQDWDDWEEMARYAGYVPNEFPTLHSFRQSLPDDFKPLVTEEVLRMLGRHSLDPDAGRIVVDMTMSGSDN